MGRRTWELLPSSGDAPYINKLATNHALARNYQAALHPSLPNYLALTGGTNAGANACDWTDHRRSR